MLLSDIIILIIGATVRWIEPLIGQLIFDAGLVPVKMLFRHIPHSDTKQAALDG